MNEVYDLLERLEELEDAPLIWINKKVFDMAQEIKRLKEQLNDEIDDELKQSEIMIKKQEEIEKLTAESTKWESKFYDEAKKVDKAIEYIEENKTTYEGNEYGFDNMLEDVIPLLDILKGSDKE